MCVVLPERSTVAVCDECKEHYCTECFDTHTCGTNVMMELYCSRYLNNACRFYWRSMRACYPIRDTSITPVASTGDRCGCAILTPHSPNLLRC